MVTGPEEGRIELTTSHDLGRVNSTAGGGDVDGNDLPELIMNTSLSTPDIKGLNLRRQPPDPSLISTRDVDPEFLLNYQPETVDFPDSPRHNQHPNHNSTNPPHPNSLIQVRSF